MTIEEFAVRYRVSVDTVKRRYREIPGISLENGIYRVADGTRYPYDRRHLKSSKRGAKVAFLLNAIEENYYIGAEMLDISEQSFQLMLDELERNEYIQRNNIGNDYGANGYDCTMEGSNYIKNKTIKEITSWVSEILPALLRLLETMLILPA